MAQASVGIPAVLVAPVRESAVLLYQSTVEALHFALGATMPRGEAAREAPHEDVRRQRERLTRLDALLVQLGWWREAEPERAPGEARAAGAEAPGGEAGPAAGDVELRAPREILRDVLYGALIDAGERLAVACGESWRAEAGLDRIRGAAMEVIALDRLLGGVGE
jgi:hypothetical protein